MSEAAALDDETKAQFAAMNVMIAEEAAAEEEERHFAVSSENWVSLLLFLDLETQWRTHLGANGLIWLGLDYAGAEALMRMKKMAVREKLIGDLMEMERAALPVLNGVAPREEDRPWH